MLCKNTGTEDAFGPVDGFSLLDSKLPKKKNIQLFSPGVEDEDGFFPPKGWTL